MSSCLKYGKKIYRPEVLLKKIREHSKFFIKKHGITHEDISKVLNPKQRDTENTRDTKSAVGSPATQYSFFTESDFDSEGNVRPEVLSEIEQEKKNLIETAKANGTYMKAPNGKDSNLNEEQWAMTRTRRFKDWFGDWENNANAKILQGNSIASLDINNAPNGGFADITKWAVNIFNSQGNNAQNPIIGNVSLNERAVKDSLAHGGANKAKVVAFEVVKDVIEKGALIHHSKQSNQESYYISAPVDISGIKNIVTVLVRKDTNSQRMYLHSVSIENRLKNSIVSETEKQQNGEKTSKSDIANILNNLLNQNTNNVSQVVDENGEPKVMYHGSPNNFTIFDSKYMGNNGTSKGKGHYFSPDKNTAMGYGEVMPVFLVIKNPLSRDILSISRKDMKNLLLDVEKNIAEKYKDEYDSDPYMLDLLYAFGDPNKEGKNRLLEKAVDMLMNEKNDVDVFGELDNTTKEYDSIAKSFRNALNKDGIITTHEYIVLEPSQIKSATDNAGTYSDNSNDIRFQIGEDQDAPALHQNLIPVSAMKEIAGVIQEKGEQKGMEVLMGSDWFKRQPKEKKRDIFRKGVSRFVLDQAIKHKENLKTKNTEKVEKTKQKEREKTREKISEIKEAYKEKIEKLKQLNSDVKAKIKIRTQAQRQVGEDLKQYILSNPLSKNLTPAQTTRLIKLANEAAMPKSRSEAVYRALDKFQEAYEKIKAQSEKQKTGTQSKQEDYEEVKKSLEEGKKPDEMKSADKKKIADRILEREKAQASEKGTGFDIQEEAFKKSEEAIKKSKPKATLRKLIEKFTDRQFVPKKLLQETGMDNTYNRFINNNGSSGRAKEWMEKMEDKVFKGIYGEDYKNLNKIIDARATISIDQYREKEGLPPIDHHNGFNQYYAQDALDTLKEKIGEEKFNQLNKRTDEYFKQHYEMTDRLLANGLISKETADVLKSREYSPRFYIEHLKDYEGDIDKQHSEIFKSSTSGLSKGAIKSLDEGSKGEKVNDTMFLMNNYMRKMSKMLSVNEMNRTFMEREFPKAKERYEQIKGKGKLTKEEKRFVKYFEELQSKVIENPIIGVTENGNIKYEHDTTPQGYSKNYYYVDGVKHEFFLADELHNQWNDTMEGFLGSGIKEVAPYVSGSAVVKFFATGNNPGFFISNTPRDFFHSIITSDQYSNIVPLSVLQMAKDSYKGLKEAYKHDYGKTNGEGLMDKYIQYGGMMDFLNQQGMIKKEGIVDKATRYAMGDKGRSVLGNILSVVTLKKLNSYSETMFRLAIMDRTLKNQLKEYNKQNNSKHKNVEEINDQQTKDDMYYRAVREARSVLDFNQGGSWTKDLESFMPYLNAGTQGARTVVDAIRKNPVGTTMRIMQVASIPTAMVTGISMYLIGALKDDDDKDRSAIDIYLDAMEGVNSNVRSNNYIIVLPTKDEKGNYQIVTIPKTQEILPIATLMDYSMENHMRKITGKKELTADFIMSRANQSLDGTIPVNPLHNPLGEESQLYEIASKNPIVKGLMATVLGINAFTKNKVSPDVGKTSIKNEGKNDTRVESFYKDIAPIADMSPARTKVFVEGFITQPTTNPYIGLIYGGADFITGNGDMEKLAKDISTSLSRRIYRSTSPFNKKQNIEQMNEKEIKEAKEHSEKMYDDTKTVADILIDKELKGNEAKKRAISELRNRGYEEGEIKKMIKNVAKLYKKERANISKGRGKTITNKYDSYLYEIKTAKSPKEKAVLMKVYFGNNISDEVKTRAKQIGGVFTKEAIVEYRKIKDKE